MEIAGKIFNNHFGKKKPLRIYKSNSSVYKNYYTAQQRIIHYTVQDQFDTQK